MLRYDETNWRFEEGLFTKNYQVFFDEIRAKSTVQEQRVRSERLSLVKFFDKNEQTELLEICKRFQKNNEDFYYTKDKKFHVTMIGFPVIDSQNYTLVREKIKEFSDTWQWTMNLKLDLIRLGTMYEHDGSLIPVCGISNGTVIGYGGILPNKDFVTFGNQLCSFLLDDKILFSILGKNFRRKFPTVWCTMGHYTKDFKISTELEKLFTEFRTLNSKYFPTSCHELELVKSCYKDLRDWMSIQKILL
jgi:hypothetical protein